MSAAVLTVLVAAALGAALGLSKRGGVVLGATHTFAVVVALVVILVELLPDALAGIGLWALLVFGGTYVASGLLERVGHAQGLEPGWGIELGFLGLLLHRVGDGLAMAHFAHGPHGVQWKGLIALGAHGVPVIALVVIAYRTRSKRSAIGRTALLATASLAGIGLHEFIPEHHAALPWISAALAGLLLQVVTHGWNTPTPSSLRSRLVDVLAVALGLVLALFVGHGHEHHGPGGEVRDATFAALVELALETGPVLVIGIAAAAALQTWGARIPEGWLRNGTAPTQALKGAFVGAPLPICACGVLPLAHSLRQRGAAPALVVAFLLATPELGIETFALSVRFLGWPFAVVRVVAAMAVAMLAALLLARAERGGMLPRGSLPPELHPDERDPVRRFVGQLDELLQHVLPWTVIGLIAAAYVEAVIPAEAFRGSSFGVDLLVISLVAVPSYVCATSATPLAAVLVMKGMAPGAVLVGLLLGPATNLATAGWLRQSYGTRATVFALGGLVCGAWGIAAIVEWIGLPVRTIASRAEHTHGAFALVSLGLLAVLALRGIWRAGLRGWLGALGESLGSIEGHGHGHGQGHGHGHGH